jgi:Protein of unknown function (DUF3140)
MSQEKILHTKKGDLSEDDAAHMRKVVGYAPGAEALGRH